MPLRHLFLLASSLLLAACSSQDAAHFKPVAPYIGRTVPLQRSMLAAPPRLAHIKPAQRVDCILFNPTVKSDSPGFLSAPATVKGSKDTTTLPKGHTVTIDSVRSETFIDGEYLVAYGHTQLSSRGSVRFAYIWGMKDIIEQAPWEPGSVAKTRHAKTGQPPLPFPTFPPVPR